MHFNSLNLRSKIWQRYLSESFCCHAKLKFWSCQNTLTAIIKVCFKSLPSDNKVLETTLILHATDHTIVEVQFLICQIILVLKGEKIDCFRKVIKTIQKECKSLLKWCKEDKISIRKYNFYNWKLQFQKCYPKNHRIKRNFGNKKK